MCIGLRLTGLVALLGLLAACSPLAAALNLAVPRSGYRVVHDVAYGSDPRQKLDIYIPDRPSEGAPVMLFFYGGSWESGSKDYYLAFGQAFASKGITVAIADYRLYPQVRYPDFIEDSASAFAYLHSHIAAYGGNPDRLFVAGHSAGAYNAMMLVADDQFLRGARADPAWIRGVIGIAGPYDFLPLEDKNLIAIFGGANRSTTQPIAHIDGRRPPMFLATGDADTTVLPRNSYRLAEELRVYHNEVEVKTYPGVAHIGIILSLAPGFRDRTTLRQDILHFVETH